MNKNILIIGAGISGLTSAICLRRQGFRVTLIEQSAQIQNIGAGIQLQPNAMRVFNALGLGDAIAKVSVKPEHGLLSVAKRGNKDGQTIATLTPPKSDAPYFHIHRADLQHILFTHCKQLQVHIELNTTLTDLKQNEHQVQVTTTDRRHFDADIVLGADGINSKVRGLLFNDAHLQLSHQTVYRAMVKASDVKQPITPSVIIDSGRHLVFYHVRNKKLINIVAQEDCQHIIEQPTEQGTSLNKCPEKNLAQFKLSYGDFDPQVSALLKAVKQIEHWPLHTLKPLSRWSVQRVCLLGDAAHPTLPNLASGAGLAIEDAYILAKLLAQHSTTSAFERFYQLRFQRCTKVQRQSQRVAQLFHTRNKALRFIQQTSIRVILFLMPTFIHWRLRWLHSYDATDTTMYDANETHHYD